MQDNEIHDAIVALSAERKLGDKVLDIVDLRF